MNELKIAIISIRFTSGGSKYHTLLVEEVCALSESGERARVFKLDFRPDKTSEWRYSDSKRHFMIRARFTKMCICLTIRCTNITLGSSYSSEQIGEVIEKSGLWGKLRSSSWLDTRRKRTSARRCWWRLHCASLLRWKEVTACWWSYVCISDLPHGYFEVERITCWSAQGRIWWSWNDRGRR